MARTILCVDDSVTMQKVAEITFDATEYNYQGARNADEGLAAAKASKPALILADAVMPGKTGYDLCQSLKADPALADVPVLIMCGNSQAYDAGRGSAVGADGHVVKPWDTQVMLDRVAEVLEAGAKPAGSGVPNAVPAASSSPMSTSPASRPAGPPPTPAHRGAAPPTPMPMPSFKMPEPPRSATIMGMPSLKLPGSPGGPNADFGAAVPVAKPPNASLTPPPMGSPPPMLRPSPPPAAPPLPRPISMPEPIAPIRPVAAPTTPAPVAAPTRPAIAAATIPEMPRPPMIKGTPRRRPPSIAALDRSAAVALEPEFIPPSMPLSPPPPTPALMPLRSSIDSRTSEAAMDVARSAGIAPDGPEMAAITKLSREVVERVVWEVVPEMAEAIIREHIAKNGLPR